MHEEGRGRREEKRSQQLVVTKALLPEVRMCLGHEMKAWAAYERHSATLERLLVDVATGSLILLKMVIL